MPTQQPSRSTASVSAEFGNFKQSFQRLLDAYLECGIRELLGTTRRVVVAKLSALALSAVGVALSIYGIVYELVHAGAINVLPQYTESVQKLATHAVMVVIFLLMAMTLSSKNVGK